MADADDREPPLQRLLAKMGMNDDQPIPERYEFIAELGRGGMGVVRLAYDRKLNRKVALKQLRDDGDPRLRELLVKEARAMAQLAHPNVVQVFEIENEGEIAFIVMEYIKGMTLRKWANVPRSVDEVIAVFRDAGEGLAAAHDKGLVHRDFKPANVMVGDDGRVRVMDFGLAVPDPDRDETLLFESGPSGGVQRNPGLAGTPPYMAPELCRDRWPTPATDQFSYCVAFYELLYRERPFAGTTHEELWAAMGRGEILEPSANTTVPAWLHDIILRGLRPDPHDRFSSMRELLDALDAGELDVGAEDHEVAPKTKIAVTPHAHVWALVLVVASVLLLGGLGLWMEVGPRESVAGPEPQPEKFEPKPTAEAPPNHEDTPSSVVPPAPNNPKDDEDPKTKEAGHRCYSPSRGELNEVVRRYRNDNGMAKVDGKPLDEICDSSSDAVTALVREDCSVEVKEFGPRKIDILKGKWDCCRSDEQKDVKCK